MSDGNPHSSIDWKALWAFGLALASGIALLVAQLSPSSMSILSLVVVTVPMSAAAIVLGAKSARRSKREGAPKAQKILAGLGVAIGAMVVTILLVALATMAIFIAGQPR